MRTIIFSNPNLLEKLRARQVTMTIRSEGYVKRNRIREGKTVKIVYKRGNRREFIGFAEVTRIEKTTMEQLNEVDAEKCGYDSTETLKTWIKIFNRFRAREKGESMELVKIHIEWSRTPTLEKYIEMVHPGEMKNGP